MTPQPNMGNRPEFVGSANDYEWLARWYGYQANVIPIWKGIGTVLIVLSKYGMPLTREEVQQFREDLKEWEIVGATYTVVSVG